MTIYFLFYIIQEWLQSELSQIYLKKSLLLKSPYLSFQTSNKGLKKAQIEGFDDHYSLMIV